MEPTINIETKAIKCCFLKSQFVLDIISNHLHRDNRRRDHLTHLRKIKTNVCQAKEKLYMTAITTRAIYMLLMESKQEPCVTEERGATKEDCQFDHGNIQILVYLPWKIPCLAMLIGFYSSVLFLYPLLLPFSTFSDLLSILHFEMQDCKGVS